MKLQEIKEAQYHNVSYIPWVKGAIATVRNDPEAPLQMIHVRDAELMQKHLTKEFGPPKFSEERGKYHVWRAYGDGAYGIEITLGMLTGQLVVQMDW